MCPESYICICIYLGCSVLGCSLGVGQLALLLLGGGILLFRRGSSRLHGIGLDVVAANRRIQILVLGTTGGVMGRVLDCRCMGWLLWRRLTILSCDELVAQTYVKACVSRAEENENGYTKACAYSSRTHGYPVQ